MRYKKKGNEKDCTPRSETGSLTGETITFVLAKLDIIGIGLRDSIKDFIRVVVLMKRRRIPRKASSLKTQPIFQTVRRWRSEA